MLIPNSRLFSCVCRKNGGKSDRKVSKELANEFAASSQNSNVGGSSGQHQTVSRVNIGQKEAAILLRTMSGSTCDNQEILGNEVLPNKVFREELAALSGQHCLWQL